MLHHKALCRDCCTTVCMREGSERWEQGRAFVLINQGQRQSSNLGFRTLHAEQQRNTFMSKYCRYISAEFCRYDTSAISSYRPIYIGVPIHRSSSSRNHDTMYDVHDNGKKTILAMHYPTDRDEVLLFAYNPQDKQLTQTKLETWVEIILTSQRFQILQ